MSKKTHIDNILSNHYIITRKLGSGSFGEVFEALDKYNNKYALKIEEKNVKRAKLQQEYQIYRSLKQVKLFNIPKLFQFIETTDYNILVIELLGSNLEEIFQQYNRRFDMNTILKLGYEIINIIQKFHQSGYVHCDIKPTNFLIHFDKNVSDIYIMDFGLSKLYINNNSHIPISNITSIIGTPRYASINVHNGIHPSRRDDLESICYMLLYFAKTKLPWQGIPNTQKHLMHQNISQIKLNTSVAELVKDLPKCFELYLLYVRKLKFNEEPNYNYLKQLFLTELKSTVCDINFIWNK